MPGVKGVYMVDGEIRLGTYRANTLGFTSNRFYDMSYLWKRGGTVLISFIASKRAGEFGRLVRHIQCCGFTVVVPTPFPGMESILRRWGARKFTEVSDEVGPVELWRIPTLELRRAEKCLT